MSSRPTLPPSPLHPCEDPNDTVSTRVKRSTRDRLRFEPVPSGVPLAPPYQWRRVQSGRAKGPLCRRSLGLPPATAPPAVDRPPPSPLPDRLDPLSPPDPGSLTRRPTQTKGRTMYPVDSRHTGPIGRRPSTGSRTEEGSGTMRTSRPVWTCTMTTGEPSSTQPCTRGNGSESGS